MAMHDGPKSYREAGITYWVPPFTEAESIYLASYQCVRVAYQWKHKATGRAGMHAVYLFKSDVQRFPKLLERWSGCTKEWEYSLPTQFHSVQ